MATAAAPVSFFSTKETTNYARLCCLLVDVGSCALQDTFDRINLPGDLHKHLQTHHTKLQQLQMKKNFKSNTMGKVIPCNTHLSVIKKL